MVVSWAVLVNLFPNGRMVVIFVKFFCNSCYLISETPWINPVSPVLDGWITSCMSNRGALLATVSATIRLLAVWDAPSPIIVINSVFLLVIPVATPYPIVFTDDTSTTEYEYDRLIKRYERVKEYEWKNSRNSTVLEVLTTVLQVGDLFFPFSRRTSSQRSQQS